MVNYLIFGSGHIGSAIIRLLIEDRATKTIYVIDKSKTQLKIMVEKLQRYGKIKPFCISSSHPRIFRLLSYGIDMIITSMPWAPTFKLIKNTRKLDIPLVSITRPNEKDLKKLYAIVSPRSSCVIVGCGLEPGLTEILARHFISIFPNITKLNIYCGGITTIPNPPIFYKQVFGDKLPISQRKAHQIKEGKLIDVERFSGIEKITLDNIGTLEAFHDGMTPWLIKDLDL